MEENLTIAILNRTLSNVERTLYFSNKYISWLIVKKSNDNINLKILSKNLILYLQRHSFRT